MYYIVQCHLLTCHKSNYMFYVCNAFMCTMLILVMIQKKKKHTLSALSAPTEVLQLPANV